MTMPLFGLDGPPAQAPATEPAAVQCRRCRRPLTDETSQGYEIGPVCRGRLGIGDTSSSPHIPWSCASCEPHPDQIALFDLDDNGALK